MAGVCKLRYHLNVFDFDVDLGVGRVDFRMTEQKVRSPDCSPRPRKHLCLHLNEVKDNIKDCRNNSKLNIWYV